MRSLDDTDKLLLTAIQKEFPLIPRPYDHLGHELGISEREALDRTNILRHKGPIRQISAIFNTRSLGYKSTLAAFKVPPDQLESAAQIVSAHPGVSHNYSREHDYDLWFTIAVPPTSRLGLERTLKILGREAGALSVLLLPTIRTFKIGVTLDMTGSSKPASMGGESAGLFEHTDRAGQDSSSLSRSKVTPPKADPLSLWREAADLEDNDDSPPPDRDDSKLPPLTSKEIELVRNLQEDIPGDIEPFAAGANASGLTVDEYLARARVFMESGHMRRFAAVLYHREAGFVANAMGVWAVPREKIEETGRIMASFDAVTHCYQRPTHPGWPYSLFTMVHARSKNECERILDAIAEATGVTDRGVLYSLKDYKKIRVRYFTPEIENWEKSRLG
jgi:DNA-binding Lrp family transcriptional regulator